VLVFYVIFLWLISINVNLIATKISAVDTRSENALMTLFLFVFVILFIVTGVMFALKTMKLEDSVMRVKGKLLFLPFVLEDYWTSQCQQTQLY
jgi:uncharacterized membrane protein (DUF485 family)